MIVNLDPNSLVDYRRFLEIKSLPSYTIRGRSAIFPDEYAERLSMAAAEPVDLDYTPHPSMFDYQRDIVRLALRKRCFCLFADCGLGKTFMFLDYIKHVLRALPTDRCVLIISPLMVIPQTLKECRRFYGDELPIEQVRAAGLAKWMTEGESRIGITNYEALQDDTPRGRLGCLVLDESSMLKSHYGKWGRKCLELGSGLIWKMACTGTPAPNDRIEFANHAVFMGAYPTVNSFLARFFVNRGQTSERWVLKGHALGPFYRSLSHWCIFLVNPGTYGWKDNSEPLPPIHIHKHHIGLTEEQQGHVYEQTSRLFPDKIGGIGSRSVLSQIAKGNRNGKAIATLKPDYIRDLVNSWQPESTIIWCLYNAEQELMCKTFPEAASISGATPHDERQRLVEEFLRGDRKILISKPKILGFGLNLQICTRQVFSGLQDSYESFYQAVKRSNRYGSTKPLNVHIPYTDIEFPMIQTVLDKAHRVQRDTEEQERIFKNATL